MRAEPLADTSPRGHSENLVQGRTVTMTFTITGLDIFTSAILLGAGSAIGWHMGAFLFSFVDRQINRMAIATSVLLVGRLRSSAQAIKDRQKRR